MPDADLRAHRLRGWLIATGVTLLAAVLRLPNLGRPHKLVFDETYYVKDAWTLLKLGYPAQWPDTPNPAFEAGDVTSYLHQASYVVHPQVGKWFIAVGEKVVGVESSVGWRISAAVAGILLVLLVTRIGRRLMRSDWLGGIAGLLVALDGLAIVQSRTGLLDGFLALLVTAAFGALLIDRDRTAERLAALGPQVQWGPFGPHLGVRGWRLVAGVLLGLSCGVKWSGIWFVAAFGLLSVGWDAAARRRAGVPRWLTGTLLRDSVPAFVSLVLVSAVTYLASWFRWFSEPDSYLHQWAAKHPGQGVTWLPDGLNSWLHYHAQMWDFHTHLTTPHDYAAKAFTWMIQWRPTSFFYETPEPAQQRCGSDHCSQAITSLGNPLIWWLGCIAILAAIWWIVRRRDAILVAALTGLAAGWLPWFLFPERTIFTFYAIVMLPFVALLVTWTAVRFLGLNEPGARWREVVTWRRVTVIVAGGLIVLVTAFFYPIWTAAVVPFWFWQLHMWLPSWV
ncbi:phospholipid carrier-dependent glycosyltransferase [Isoptericola sp. b490]|uniref:dolichyl-phosphate-mannose--protein mannosyltransferase n=1 Tax=Actinotalea lenta TaxID=3064654 RepID=UPI0027125617|nr:phospholipid carrier-dependent glycosyltransferase [Isoptericola sp. b490]MDO8121511.1 phospholipid carrier-dependent glycosyltransferase [Isoptericola sp. b490]